MRECAGFRYHIPIAPHGVASLLGQMAYAHVCSTVPNFMMLEWMHYFNKNMARLTPPPPYDAGFLQVSEAPGIGVALNEDVLKELLLPGYEL